MSVIGLFAVLTLLLGTTTIAAHGSGGGASTTHVVQFVVHANEKTDVTRLFPGAYVDFTWNNVFVVSIWTNDPNQLIKSVKETLDLNTDSIKTLVAPYSLEDSTQKWLQYNLVWVLLLVLVFTSGCVCGATLIKKCFEADPKVTTTSRSSSSSGGSSSSTNENNNKRKTYYGRV